MSEAFLARSMSSSNNQRAENRTRPVAMGVGALVVLTIVQLVRVKGVPVTRSLWAEDGSAFLSGALVPRSIFTTYAGYLNVVPRVIAWFGALLPLGWASAWFSIVPALLTSLLALAVFRLSDFVVSSRWLRAVLALSFVLPPILVYETMADTANLQWPLLAALFWALARPVAARWDLGTCAVIALVAPLSSSVALLFIPLMVFVAIIRRSDRRALIVPAVFGFACCVQVVAILTTSSPTEQGPSDVLGLPRLFVVNVVGEAVLGHPNVDRAWLNLGLAAFVVLAVAVGGALALLWWRCDSEGRRWGGIALVMSVFVYSSAVYFRGTKLVFLTEGAKTGSFARYSGVALQLLVAAAIVLVARAKVSERLSQVLVVLLVAQAVLVPLSAFRLTTLRSAGPRWDVALGRARQECEQDAPDAVRLVPIAPRGEAWFAAIPCSDLR